MGWHAKGGGCECRTSAGGQGVGGGYRCLWLGIEGNCIHSLAPTHHWRPLLQAQGCTQWPTQMGRVGVVYNAVGGGGGENGQEMTQKGECKETGCDEKSFGGRGATCYFRWVVGEGRPHGAKTWGRAGRWREAVQRPCGRSELGELRPSKVASVAGVCQVRGGGQRVRQGRIRIYQPLPEASLVAQSPGERLPCASVAVPRYPWEHRQEPADCRGFPLVASVFVSVKWGL